MPSPAHTQGISLCVASVALHSSFQAVCTIHSCTMWDKQLRCTSPDACLAKVKGADSRHLQDGTLGCAVWHKGRLRHKRTGRCNVDDGPCCLGSHHGSGCMLSCKGGALDICRQHLIPVCAHSRCNHTPQAAHKTSMRQQQESSCS